MVCCVSSLLIAPVAGAHYSVWLVCSHAAVQAGSLAALEATPNKTKIVKQGTPLAAPPRQGEHRICCDTACRNHRGPRSHVLLHHADSHCTTPSCFTRTFRPYRRQHPPAISSAIVAAVQCHTGSEAGAATKHTEGMRRCRSGAVYADGQHACARMGVQTLLLLLFCTATTKTQRQYDTEPQRGSFIEAASPLRRGGGRPAAAAEPSPAPSMGLGQQHWALSYHAARTTLLP